MVVVRIFFSVLAEGGGTTTAAAVLLARTDERPGFLAPRNNHNRGENSSTVAEPRGGPARPAGEQIAASFALLVQQAVGGIVDYVASSARREGGVEGAGGRNSEDVFQVENVDGQSETSATARTPPASSMHNTRSTSYIQDQDQEDEEREGDAGDQHHDQHFRERQELVEMNDDDPDRPEDEERARAGWDEDQPERPRPPDAEKGRGNEEREDVAWLQVDTAKQDSTSIIVPGSSPFASVGGVGGKQILNDILTSNTKAVAAGKIGQDHIAALLKGGKENINNHDLSMIPGVWPNRKLQPLPLNDAEKIPRFSPGGAAADPKNTKQGHEGAPAALPTLLRNRPSPRINAESEPEKTERSTSVSSSPEVYKPGADLNLMKATSETHTDTAPGPAKRQYSLQADIPERIGMGVRRFVGIVLAGLWHVKKAVQDFVASSWRGLATLFRNNLHDLKQAFAVVAKAIQRHFEWTTHNTRLSPGDKDASQDLVKQSLPATDQIIEDVAAQNKDATTMEKTDAIRRVVHFAFLVIGLLMLVIGHVFLFPPLIAIGTYVLTSKALGLGASALLHSVGYMISNSEEHGAESSLSSPRTNISPTTSASADEHHEGSNRDEILAELQKELDQPADQTLVRPAQAGGPAPVDQGRGLSVRGFFAQEGAGFGGDLYSTAVNGYAGWFATFQVIIEHFFPGHVEALGAVWDVGTSIVFFALWKGNSQADKKAWREKWVAPMQERKLMSRTQEWVMEELQQKKLMLRRNLGGTDKLSRFGQLLPRRIRQAAMDLLEQGDQSLPKHVKNRFFWKLGAALLPRWRGVWIAPPGVEPEPESSWEVLRDKAQTKVKQHFDDTEEGMILTADDDPWDSIRGTSIRDHDIEKAARSLSARGWMWKYIGVHNADHADEIGEGVLDTLRKAADPECFNLIQEQFEASYVADTRALIPIRDIKPLTEAVRDKVICAEDSALSVSALLGISSSQLSPEMKQSEGEKNASCGKLRSKLERMYKKDVFVRNELRDAEIKTLPTTTAAGTTVVYADDVLYINENDRSQKTKDSTFCREDKGLGAPSYAVALWIQHDAPMGCVPTAEGRFWLATELYRERFKECATAAAALAHNFTQVSLSSTELAAFDGLVREAQCVTLRSDFFRKMREDKNQIEAKPRLWDFVSGDELSGPVEDSTGKASTAKVSKQCYSYAMARGGANNHEDGDFENFFRHLIEGSARFSEEYPAATGNGSGATRFVSKDFGVGNKLAPHGIVELLINNPKRGHEASSTTPALGISCNDKVRQAFHSAITITDTRQGARRMLPRAVPVDLCSYEECGAFVQEFNRLEYAYGAGERKVWAMAMPEIEMPKHQHGILGAQFRFRQPTLCYDGSLFLHLVEQAGRIGLGQQERSEDLALFPGVAQFFLRAVAEGKTRWWKNAKSTRDQHQRDELKSIFGYAWDEEKKTQHEDENDKRETWDPTAGAMQDAVWECSQALRELGAGPETRLCELDLDCNGNTAKFPDDKEQDLHDEQKSINCIARSKCNAFIRELNNLVATKVPTGDWYGNWYKRFLKQVWTGPDVRQGVEQPCLCAGAAGWKDAGCSYKNPEKNSPRLRTPRHVEEFIKQLSQRTWYKGKNTFETYEALSEEMGAALINAFEQIASPDFVQQKERNKGIVPDDLDKGRGLSLIEMSALHKCERAMRHRELQFGLGDGASGGRSPEHLCDREKIAPACFDVVIQLNRVARCTGTFTLTNQADANAAAVQIWETRGHDDLSYRTVTQWNQYWQFCAPNAGADDKLLILNGEDCRSGLQPLEGWKGTEHLPEGDSAASFLAYEAGKPPPPCASTGDGGECAKDIGTSGRGDDRLAKLNYAYDGKDARSSTGVLVNR